jgi:hypothetical protein
LELTKRGRGPLSKQKPIFYGKTPEFPEPEFRRHFRDQRLLEAPGHLRVGDEVGRMLRQMSDDAVQWVYGQSLMAFIRVNKPQ